MDCDQIEREEIIEKYLTGKLDKAGQKELESHCFGCPKCFETLQVQRALQEELWKQAKIVSPAPSEERRLRIRGLSIVSVAAGLVIIVVLAILWYFGRTGERSIRSGETSASLGLLAAFEPPPYIPPALRGAADEATERFRAGMKFYQESRYAEALPNLQAAAGLNPQAASIRFFLGICLLLTGQADPGIAELQKAIALGDVTYLNEAHFYLAKGYLRKGDASAARKELQTVAESGGKLSEDAARLLKSMEKALHRLP